MGVGPGRRLGWAAVDHVLYVVRHYVKHMHANLPAKNLINGGGVANSEFHIL